MADGFKAAYDEHMVGRNGGDAISRACLIAALILVILSFFCVGIGPFIYVLVLVLGLAAAVYAALRMNSRDVEKRQRENDAFTGFFRREGKGGERDRGEREERPRRERRTAVDYEERPRRERRTSFEEEDRPRERTRRRAADRPRQSAEPRQEYQERRERPERPEPAAAETPQKVIAVCENCGQRLSIPAGKGNIRITCPKCSHRFTMFS